VKVSALSRSPWPCLRTVVGGSRGHIVKVLNTKVAGAVLRVNRLNSTFVGVERLSSTVSRRATESSATGLERRQSGLPYCFSIRRRGETPLTGALADRPASESPDIVEPRNPLHGKGHQGRTALRVGLTKRRNIASAILITHAIYLAEDRRPKVPRRPGGRQ